MLNALQVNFEGIGHTTQNKNVRLLKLLADMSTGLKPSMLCYVMLLCFRKVAFNSF